MQQLIIRLLESDGQTSHAEWSLFTKGIKTSGSNGAIPLAELQEALTEECFITVLVPGQQVLLGSVTVPRKQQRHLSGIVPFLVEDHLAESIASVHVAHASSTGKDGNFATATVKRSVMESWLHLLESEGISPQEMLAEHSLLPYAPGHWTLLCDAHTAWLRISENESFAIELSMLPALVGIIRDTSPNSPVSVECLSELNESDISAMVKPYNLALNFTKRTSVFEVLCESYFATSTMRPLNLRQGEFRSRNHKDSQGMRWKAFAKIAAFWFVGMMLIDGGQALYFSYKTEQMRGRSIALYHQLFPEDSKIIDPRRQLESKINGAYSQSGGFLPLLQQVQAAWPAGEMPAPLIQNLVYSESDDLLTLSVTGSSIEFINRLVQTLNGNGLKAKMQSVIHNNEGVTGQISIRGNAS